MRVTSLGFQTDLALRVLEGAEITDRGDFMVVRSPDNPTFWWGNFLLLAGWPEPGTGDGWLARFAAEFPQAEHLALGVDTGAEPAEVPPEFLAAGLAFERATVLTCTVVQPPPAAGWPATRTSRPTPGPAGRVSPGRWSGARGCTRPRRSARAPSSSWPTRPKAPSGSTGPAASPTRRASSASSGGAKDKPLLGHHRGDQLGRGDVEREVECAGPWRRGLPGDLLVRPLLDRDRRAGRRRRVQGR